MEYRVWSIYILHSLYVCTCKHKFHCGNIYTLISRVYKILEEHGPKSLYGVECCVWSEKAMAPHSSLLPGKSHGRRSLVGCSSWGRKESDMTEQLHFHFSLSCIGEGNGNPLQCSCLENPRDGGAWWGAVYGVAWTRLKRLSSSSSCVWWWKCK